MIKNEKIKAAEVQLSGIHGEDLGIVSTKEALAMAKQLKVDLVCTSLMTSPPPCRLIPAGKAKEEIQQANKRERTGKIKEIRLTPHIEDHDYETKKMQAERILRAGNSVQLVLRLSAKDKESQKARALLEELLRDLADSGQKGGGIQVSGKQISVLIQPKEHDLK